MNDLIDRQAAIEIVKRIQMDSGFEAEKWIAVEDIENLPSAQPETHEERTETHACDLISRQAAIDALSNLMDTDGFRDGWAVSRSNVECMLRALPTAQPDLSGYSDKLWKAAYERSKEEGRAEGLVKLKTGKAGRWIDEGFYADYHSAHAFRCSECGGHIIEDDPDPFCRWCGADMRKLEEEKDD